MAWVRHAQMLTNAEESVNDKVRRCVYNFALSPSFLVYLQVLLLNRPDEEERYTYLQLALEVRDGLSTLLRGRLNDGFP